MIAHAKHIMKTCWFNSDDWVEWAAPRWADNMKKCSCDMCGNPRQHGERTLQERRFDQVKDNDA